MGCDEDPSNRRRTVEIILKRGHPKGEGNKPECTKGKENHRNLRSNGRNKSQLILTMGDTSEEKDTGTVGKNTCTQTKVAQCFKKKPMETKTCRQIKKKINFQQKSIRSQIEQWFVATRKAYWVGYDVDHRILEGVRPKEWEQIMGFFCQGEESYKHALYITGTPGTGKSVFVSAIIKELQDPIRRDSMRCPTIKRILFYNGMSIVEHTSKQIREKSFMEQILRDLTPQEIKKSKARSPKIDYRFYIEKLKKYLCGPEAIPTVIIIDEMDHLNLESEDGVVNRLLRWTTEKNSHLWLVGISNTMDLIKSNEKHYISKEHGLFKWEECHFMPYETQHVSFILLERLKAVLNDQEQSQLQNISTSRNKTKINWAECNYGIHPLALEICARKIANVGDIRKALSIFRASIDDAFDYNKIEQNWPYIIMPDHITRVMVIGPNTGLSSESLKALSIHIQLILLAIAKAKMEDSDTPSIDIVFHKYKKFIHQINISLTPLIREEVIDSISLLQNQGYLSLESKPHLSKPKSHSISTNFIKPQMSVDTILSMFKDCEHLHNIINTIVEDHQK